MITEIAHLVIKAGEEAEFEKKVSLAKPHFLSANGCHGVTLARCIENPQQYQLFVQWETVDHHMVEFRQSENFQRWRELASPHFQEPPSVEHVADVPL
jgi:heme-degrading monooxygenase HmoA